MMKMSILFAIIVGSAFAAHRLEFPTQHQEGRIIGGTDAGEGEFPYQVSLRNFEMFGHVCGAAIISEYWAVTAAACIKGFTADYFDVMVGSNKRNGGSIYNVSYIAWHPNFNFSTMDSDIAVIKVSPAFEFNDKVKPITLPAVGDEPKVGSNAIVSGWGITSTNGGGLSENLKKITVPIVDLNECREDYSEHNVITEHMFCAGVKEGGKDGCLGDSGGPLVIDGIMYGVVSWGYGCAEPNYPGVYSKVSSLLEFIKEQTGL